MATFFIGVIVVILLNFICLGLMISSSDREKEEERAWKEIHAPSNH